MPTVGPAHGGFEFLKGSFEGLKGYAVGRMTKSHRGKLYIDDAGWGPDAGSIEYGYRVPFGGIHVFIGKIGEPGPELDLRAGLIETAQRARPARARPGERPILPQRVGERRSRRRDWARCRRESRSTCRARLGR